MINFYTDGAYSIKNNRGGWAFYSPELNLRVIGTEYNTTNNRMELMAVIKVLEFISDSNVEDKEITINSDSMYVIGVTTQNWSKEKNLDLWSDYELLISLLFDKKINFQYIKGHSDNIENNIADCLAVQSTHYLC